MKIEIDPLRIIKETRLEKHVFTISRAEIAYIVKHKALTAEQKLLWLLLASMSSEEEDLSCPFSDEDLAKIMNVDCSHLLEACLELEAMGFLKRYSGEREERCRISLPNEGLLHLRLAKRKETPKWLETIRERMREEVFRWW